MESETNERVNVSKKDFLEQDPQIRGQNYVCLSFLSPDDVIKSKDAYIISAYMKSLCQRNTELVNGLEVLFPDKTNEIRSIKEQYSVFFDSNSIDEDFKSFKIENEIDISNKFSEENNYQTSIRGIKIRGTYETQKEAEIRAEVLKRIDNNFHNIYIAQVGCWCPWSANPDEIQDGEYSETELNTLMREYKKNCENKDIFYNERKKELIERTHKQTHNDNDNDNMPDIIDEDEEVDIIDEEVDIIDEKIDIIDEEVDIIDEDEEVDITTTTDIEKSLFEEGQTDQTYQER